MHVDKFEAKPEPLHTKPENPVYITTFKSVQNEDGDTIIETENKKVTQDEGVVVEEVLSDSEVPTVSTHNNVEIVEINEYTGEVAEVYKDYKVIVAEEEPENPTEEYPMHTVKVVDEEPELQESHPIAAIEEEEEIIPEVLEEKEDIKKIKKKKKIVKPKTDDYDAIIQKLLEQDIEKTELEKYEKIEFEKPIKLKAEFENLEPIKIVKREQKPTKVQIIDTEEIPQTIKLKARKLTKKPEEKQEDQFSKLRLKSRMEKVSYPPEALIPKITHIGAVKEKAELSRNIEEAEECLKYKPRKAKKLKKIKDDLEKVELEKYEKYISSEDEDKEKTPYEKPEKVPKPEDVTKDVNLKLGKGKKKPVVDDQQENISLKKVPEKPNKTEEESVTVPKKTEDNTHNEGQKAPDQPTYEMTPIEPIGFEDSDYVKDELEPIEYPEESDRKKKEHKPKRKPKQKNKPEQEYNVTHILPGAPKDKEESPEENIKFKIPESDSFNESVAEIKLKPFEKAEEEVEKEGRTHVLPEKQQEQKVPSPVSNEEPKKSKKSKTKKVQLEEEIPDIEKEDDFVVSLTEEESIDKVSKEDRPMQDVKVKKKKPIELPLAEVMITEELPKVKETPEDIPIEYKITTTVTEPEERPEEHKVRVIDIHKKEVTLEEVVEERVVTRRKKAKPQLPDTYEHQVTEAEQEDLVDLEEIEESMPSIKETEESFIDVKVVEEQPIYKISTKETSPDKLNDVTAMPSVEDTSKEFKISLVKKSDSEEIPEAEFTIKKTTQETIEEPETEFSFKEAKPIEEITQEAEIKVRKPKKKPKEFQADELKIKITEEAPLEKSDDVIEEIKETVSAATEELFAEQPSEYKYTMKEMEPEIKLEIVEPKEEVSEKSKEKADEIESKELNIRVIETFPEKIPDDDQEVKLYKKSVVPFVTEEPEEEITLSTKAKISEPEETAIIKKKPKNIKDDQESILQITVIEHTPEVKEEMIELEENDENIHLSAVGEKTTQDVKPIEYTYKVKENEQNVPEEITQEEIKLPQKKPVQSNIIEETEIEFCLKPKTEIPDVEEEVKIKKKKPKKIDSGETAAELNVKVEKEVVPEAEIVEIEDIQESVKETSPGEEQEIKQIPKKSVDEIPEEKIIKLKKRTAPNIQEEVGEEEFSVDISLPKEKQITEETHGETVLLKEKNKPIKVVEEAADQLELRQEIVEERPIEIEEEEIIEEAVVMRKKPKKKLEPTIEDHEEQEFSLSLKKPLQIIEGVTEDATVLKKRKQKPVHIDEAEAELSIKREEEYEESEDVEEFVISEKPKRKPLQITEEQEEEYTVKKSKGPAKKAPKIPEFSDVENVTFRAKSSKPKEDIEQEFNIALDSYAEEEISMSSKVKLKKPIKKTYSEAADEAKIKVIRDYDDGEGPIIEEIRDDSSIEDTMYDVEEPEEYLVEELPPDEVDFKLKPKKSVKPRYSIQNEEEEQFLIGIRHPKRDSVTYEEDSLTFKKKKKVLQQVFNEDGASLNITREMDIEETDDENVMYSICNYVADNDEAINLVEGEKVKVIGRHSSEWWYVRKNITEEEGWVPAQYLMEPVEYTEYVQKKLHEKIDKLPVFERPGPDEKPVAPRFIEKLQPIHTPDGYTVQFECKVEGIPRPQIAWFRETAIIKPSQDFQMFYDDDNVATLIIREVFPEDSGKFTCVAKNSAGFTSTTTELIVETPLSDHGSDATGMSRKSMSRESSLADILEGIPPTFSRKPKAQYVDEDSNVILECRLVAVPEPDIIWKFNGEEISTNDTKNVRIVTESDMHMYCSVVHITKVKKTQEGTYEVIATNREGESKLPIILKVRTIEKEPPQILEPLRNMVIREGESVVLSAQIVGNPPPTIIWYKDGKQIKLNTKTEKDIHTLTILTPKREEKGEYTVKATNPLGTVETTAYLTIEEPSSGNAEPPLFVERFQEQTVPQKGIIRLPAKVSGNPVPEIQWLFNNNPLYPSERVQQVYDGENIELIIKEANPDTDSGDYKCIASNPIGKTSHGARVIVEVDEVTFTKKLKKTITIEEVQSLTLECETSHVVSTKWFFNGKELSGMDHRVVVEDGKVHKLVIKNTNLRDTGLYVCKVKDQETQSTVDVLPRKPEFIKILEDYEVTEKETAILDVEVTTDAAEVTWYRDGEKITPENKNVEFIKEGKIRKLIIRNTSIHDEAEYTCKLDDQECSAELVIIELPPEIVKPLEDITVTKGENATFEIELSKGDALVKWFKNGNELKFNEHVQLTIDGKKQTLRIINTISDDIAEYSMQVGKQISKAKLDVEEPLVDFVVRLPDVTIATKSTDAEFYVELSQPNVEVNWRKAGQPIKVDKKHEIFVEGTVRRLIIHEADNDDVCDISCTAANVTTTSKLCVEDIKTPPIIISDKKQTIKVKENDDVTMTIKYSGLPKPNAEWNTSKKVITSTKRTIPTLDEQSASLTLKKVVEEDEDEYRLKLVNPVGEAEASLHLVIMRKPTAPGAPQALEVVHDSITLYWKAPDDDGKSEIIEYILEYKDVKEEKWTEIRKIKDTTYTLSKLQIDKEYVFRAVAVNEVGPSPPSPVSPSIRLVAELKKEKPKVQEPLQDIVTELNKEVTLSCVFSGIPEPKTTWKKNGDIIESNTIRCENRISKYTIEKTTVETEATFTCVAENEIGSVETSCKVIVQEKPIIDIEEKNLAQKLRSGTNVSIPATIRGYPQPKIKWYKETVEQTNSKRVTIETTQTTSTYSIQNLTREDSGRYKITAINNCGTAYVECVINVIDKPTRPQSLDIKDIKKDAVTLEWTPPIDDGGLDINKYILEKCDTQNNVWMKVADFDKNIHSYAIQKLSMNSQYMFRVVATNPIGESEPTESDPITITKKLEKPSPPRGPLDVSGMTDSSFTLSWQPSETDGGSKIIEYIIEIKEKQEQDYTLLGRTLSNVTNIFVENVTKDRGYQFRIFAKNQVGISEAFESDDTIVVGRRIIRALENYAPPSPPQNLRTPDITSRSVTLDWEVPTSNGGSEITGYCVEKRSSTATKWTKVITLDAHCLQYTVDNLKEKCEYWFRVSAENSVGLGAPAVTDEIALKTHATVPSPPTAPLEARVIAANAHVFEWGIPESDGGAPLLGYHIAIRDMKKTMWIEVGRVPAGVQKFQIRDLQEDHDYMIRIFAKNEIGLSEPLESEEPYKVITTGHASLPDEPRTEMSTCNTSSWLRDHNMDADIHSYARGKLLRRDEYFFRIWAKMPKKKRNSKET